MKGRNWVDILNRTADIFEKSSLHLALDSANPLVMTKALLDTGLWEHVNEDFNLYTDGSYTFSPYAYVEEGVWDGNPSQVESVLLLLKSYRVKRLYWRNKGEQPANMNGAPPEIVSVLS